MLVAVLLLAVVVFYGGAGVGSVGVGAGACVGVGVDISQNYPNGVFWSFYSMHSRAWCLGVRNRAIQHTRIDFRDSCRPFQGENREQICLLYTSPSPRD